MKRAQRYLHGIVVRPVRRMALLLALALLAGCSLSSGVTETTGRGPSGGSLTVEFVTSDSLGEREELTLAASQERRQLTVICTASLESGKLEIELLNPDGTPAFKLEGKPGREQVASGTVETDDLGQLRYRVLSEKARHGNYRIVYKHE